MNALPCHTCHGVFGVDCGGLRDGHDPSIRSVVFCQTCGGHVGVAGSPGEHCDDTTHVRHDDLWDASDEPYWARYYERQVRSDRRAAETEARRQATPLTARLRHCGVRPASDGQLSVHLPEIADAHDAADMIDALIAVAERLTRDGPERDAARAQLDTLAEQAAGIVRTVRRSG